MLRLLKICNLLGAMLLGWAKKWGIPPAAIAELRALMCAVNTDPSPKNKAFSETDVQNRTRLNASKCGWRLWRNNVGVDTEHNVRYGLCNESHQMNKEVKSSDLIGVRPVMITPAYVGAIIGQFVAVECKRGGWRYTGRGRERAQLRFLELVIGMGGLAYFERGENQWTGENV